MRRRPSMAAAIALKSTLTLALTSGVTSVVLAGEADQPVSAEVAAYVAEQLYELQKRFDSGPPVETLVNYGISKDNDLYEGNLRHGRVPPSAGFASQVEDVGKHQTDPALTLGTASALQAELGRAPTTDEVNVRIAEFNTRIQQLNAQLAEQHTALATAQAKSGRLPLRIVAQLAEPVMRPDVVTTRYAAENNAVSAEERRRGDWEIVKGLLELLASKR